MRRLRRAGFDSRALAKYKRGLRVGGRVVLLTTVACVLGFVAVRFTGVVAENFAFERELAASHADIAALQARLIEQRRTIDRLNDPHGALPEIHDKLRFVGEREEIIYVRGLGDALTDPHAWHPQSADDVGSGDWRPDGADDWHPNR
jgi:cell division protein FtsB